MRGYRKSSLTILAIGGFAAVLADRGSTRCRGEAPGPAALTEADRETLRRYARDTWRSFVAMEVPGGLPADGLAPDDGGGWKATAKTSPTDVGAYLWSVLAAERLGLIDAPEAGRRLERTLAALGRADRLEGFFFDRLDPRDGRVLVESPRGGKPNPRFLSAVDNGWLAAALIMVGNTHPALRARTDAILGPMDFHFFYEPFDPGDRDKHPGQLHGTYRPDDRSFGTLHGLVNTEPRIASYIGIARGQLPRDHYYRMDRAWVPGGGGASHGQERKQKQRPDWRACTYFGVEVYEGHYTYRGMRIVPSWGGSMFEALMVPLFVPEERWAPRSWGVNHPLYVRAQIEHGLEEAHYGFWGFSPASRPGGGYTTYGVDALGVNPEGYPSYDRDEPGPAPEGSPRRAHGVVTPHASFLTLRFAPREAMANLKALADAFEIYGPYGFHDSVDVATGQVAQAILALDQGMILAAIANALADDAMRRAFCAGAVEQVLRPLIAVEEFTAGPQERARPSS